MSVDRSWLHRFAKAVRHVSLDNFSITNTCIATTRLGAYVLDAVGVSARPQPVFVEVWNMKGWHLAQEGVPVSEWPSDAWSIYVGDHGEQVDGWRGHLVLVVKQPGEPRLMIDLTADQFDRPQHDLNVGGPVFMGIGGAWTPQDSLSAVSPNREDPSVILTYRPMPPGHRLARVWRQTPDWTIGEPEMRTAARKIAALLDTDAPD